MEFTTVKEVTHEEKSVQETEALLLAQQQEQQQIRNEQAVKDPPPPPPNDELDDNIVLSHINKKTNKEYKSFDEIIAPQIKEVELPENVAEYYKYTKETGGRSINDYINSQRDFSKEDPKKLLAEYIAIKNPSLDKEDIEYEVSKFDYDEDLDSEAEIKSKKIAMKKELSEAITHFEKEREQYKIPLESRSNLVPEEDKEAYEAFKRTVSDREKGKVLSDYFVKKTNELFTNDFKGFDFNVGEKTITFIPGEAEKLKQAQINVGNFVNSHLDENGYIKDAAAYHKSLAVAMNADLFAKHFYEQGQADLVSKQAIESKNINMGTVRNTPVVQIGKEGMQVRAVEESHGSGLKIPSRKKQS